MLLIVLFKSLDYNWFFRGRKGRKFCESNPSRKNLATPLILM